MFDVQLKEAGYAANDFKDAGYNAMQLSYEYFWRDLDDMVGMDSQWKETYAFFSATELRAANYSTEELLRAGFSDVHMRKAEDVAVAKQTVLAKAMPTSKRRRRE